MSLDVLTMVIAAMLLAAFAVGWVAHWAWARMLARSSPRSDRADELAAELLIVEEDRDRIAAEARATEDAFRAEAAATESGLQTRLRECEAELEAAMDGLRAARAERDS